MKIIMASLILTTLFGTVLSQNSNSNIYLLISPYSPEGKNKSISVYEFNTTTGQSTLKSKIDDVVNPSYMVVSPDKKFVYSVNETGKGELSAFSFNKATGTLTFINKVSTGGNGPCYISTDDKRRFVFAANYGSGSVTAVPVNADGSLGSDFQAIFHEANPENKGRQKGAHAHSTVLSPDNKYLMVPDLGIDKVNIYSIDYSRKSNPLTPSEPRFLSVKAGSGPRHFIFHPNGKYAYLIHELQGFVSVYDYKEGVLTEKQTITLLSNDFKGSIGAADIHISPDGKFLYGSNRGDANEIVIYSIKRDGTLGYIGRQSTLGKGPRNFVIDPTGNFLLAGNSNSDFVSVFKRDKKTGMLTPTDIQIKVVEPGCLKFITE